MSESSSDPQQTEAAPALRPAFMLDASVLGDNVLDIANFTIAKYEFNNPELSPGVREEIVTKIQDALWQRIEEVKKEIERRRRERLQEMFSIAEKTLHGVLSSKQ